MARFKLANFSSDDPINVTKIQLVLELRDFRVGVIIEMWRAMVVG